MRKIKFILDRKYLEIINNFFQFSISISQTLEYGDVIIDKCTAQEKWYSKKSSTKLFE